jgi:hypothetical protein
VGCEGLGSCKKSLCCNAALCASPPPRTCK